MKATRSHSHHRDEPAVGSKLSLDSLCALLLDATTVLYGAVRSSKPGFYFGPWDNPGLHKATVHVQYCKARIVPKCRALPPVEIRVECTGDSVLRR